MGAKAFRAANGEYLVAEEGHLHTHHAKDHRATFHIEQHDGGSKVSLKTHNGHFVAVNGQQEIYMRHDHKSDEAKFELEHHSGRVALKSHHGGYLHVNQEGRVHVHHERDPASLFEEEKA